MPITKQITTYYYIGPFNMFAKIFNTSFGQVLVKLDESREIGVVEVRFYVELVDLKLGICSTEVFFDGPDAWPRAEAYFYDVDEKLAIAKVRRLIDTMQTYHNFMVHK